MFPGCSSKTIHARGLCRAHHQKYRRVIQGTKETANSITWDDLVALGRCLESRQGARDPEFMNELLGEIKKLGRTQMKTPARTATDSKIRRVDPTEAEIKRRSAEVRRKRTTQDSS